MHHKNRFTLEKITRRLKLIQPLVYRQRQALPPLRYLELPGAAAPPLFDGQVWPEIQPGSAWGMPRTNFVLQTEFAVDPGDGPAALFLPLGESGDFSHPEAQVYIDGLRWAACDRHHQEVLLHPDHCTGAEHILTLHGWTGLAGWRTGEATPLIMRPCEVVRVNAPTRRLVALTRVALETAQRLPDGNPARHRLLNALEEAFLALDTREPVGKQAFYDSVEPALEALKAGIERGGPPLDVVIHATGHAHIDVAWLWTLAQTRRKAARTFTTVLRLMEQFPAYHFTQSQPQLYDYILEDEPDLFEAIRDRVREGRWEPIGGMWVEADCNLSGPESLARQFLLGRTYFREHFGPEAESPVLWLPDVFGYAWALPQLIRQAGLKYFMTIKIGWNQYNRLPYDTFLWQGLDGSRVLTHFSTVKEYGSPYASTYNSKATPGESLGAWESFQQKELHPELLMAYGYGDGGGGPTREMLENIDLMGRFPGLPRVQQSSARAFFEAIEAQVDSPRMPVWNGELYLEYHRGTYTTQSRNKRANRKAEFTLHDAEFLAAWASLAAGLPYPREAYEAAWKTVCLNQFHDIIPGSSIGEVYAESLAQYAQLEKDALALRDAALEALTADLDADLVLVNPTSFPQPGIALAPDAAVYARAGKSLPAQPSRAGTWVDAGELPPYSLTPLTRMEVAIPAPQFDAPPPEGGRYVLENDLLRCEFDRAGDLVRIFDRRASREVLPPGAVGNRFQAFEDRPLEWDAWDVDIFHDDSVWTADPADAIEWHEFGPLRRTLTIRRRILNSNIHQRVSLDRNSPRLDFETVVEWNEQHILLKVAFPVDVLSPQATYEIQWGSVQRPTHRNTSWDWARFESCAQKWIDLSEGGYGVSLLNDCKYGHDVQGQVLRLTLLRSPTWPDPDADRGEHRFTYSLLPHPGGWDERTLAAAYGLNDPVIAWRVNSGPQAAEERTPASGRQFLEVSPANIVIETVKRAEDGRGLIVRLFESQRRRGTAVLQTGFRLQRAWETNLLEEDQFELEVESSQVRLSFRPFQIMTLRLIPADPIESK